MADKPKILLSGETYDGASLDVRMDWNLFRRACREYYRVLPGEELAAVGLDEDGIRIYFRGGADSSEQSAELS